jgi:hypothetical protein
MTEEMVHAAILPTIRAKNAMAPSAIRDLIETRITQSLTALNHGRVNEAASLLSVATHRFY